MSSLIQAVTCDPVPFVLCCRLRKAVLHAIANSRSNEHDMAARLNESMMAKVGLGVGGNKKAVTRVLGGGGQGEVNGMGAAVRLRDQDPHPRSHELPPSTQYHNRHTTPVCLSACLLGYPYGQQARTNAHTLSTC